MLLLHYTGMSGGDAALARLCDPASDVSCHYLVWEDGAVDQLVSEACRAWHAGRGSWRGDTDINSVSIGIEIVNAGHDGGCPPYPDAQIDAVIALSRDICVRHAIPRARVLGHSDVAPSRKQDPGEHFPWDVLARKELGLWVSAPLRAGPDRLVSNPLELARLRMRLHEIGFAVPPSESNAHQMDDVVRSFQRHWRPDRVDGILDSATAMLIDAVADAAST